MDIDQHLLKQCIKNDRKAQQQLYKQSFSFLMGISVRYVVNDADARALVNLGFLKVLQNLNYYNSSVPFGVWIRKIMINTIIDNFRKNKKEKNHLQIVDFQDYDVYSNPDFQHYNTALQQFDAEDLRVLIKQLPPMSRRVFNLYAIDGYNHREIGEMLDIAEGTSKWHLSFARKKLQEMVKQLINEKPHIAVKHG